MASLGGSTAGAAELDPAVADALNEARRVRDAVINTDADPHTAANAELDYAAELHAHHQVREARDAYQRALQRDASLFAPHHLLGVLEASLGNNEAARMHFDAALARQPNVPATLIRRGDLLRGLGDLDAADADYRTAILLDPGAAAAHAGGENLQIAANFLLFSAPALLAAGLLAAHGVMRWGAATLALGVVLFSGDLVARHYVGGRLFPMAAPAGGLLMIAGWLTIGLGAFVVRR